MIKVILSNGRTMTVDASSMILDGGILTMQDSKGEDVAFSINPIAAWHVEECEEDMQEAQVTPRTDKSNEKFGAVFLGLAFALGIVALFAAGYGIGKLMIWSGL